MSNDATYVVRLLDDQASSNIVIGDSEVGLQPLIPGYQFVGPAGLQPEEMNDLVRYLFAWRQPARVIVEAAPQFFGALHIGRQKRFLASNLPPNFLPLRPLTGSTLVRQQLKSNLLKDASAIATFMLPIGAALGAPLAAPAPSVVYAAAQRWAQASASTGEDFDWSEMPSADRELLTLARSFDFNPRPGALQSDSEAAFRSAIKYLLSRGAQVCLFRPPVTSLMLAYEPMIENSRFAEFDTYIRTLSSSLKVPYLTIDDLGMRPDDHWFWNQDHMRPRKATDVWRAVADRCFDK